MFSLLKIDKRVRIQVFLLVLIVLGDGPRADGLKCNKCDVEGGCNPMEEIDCPTANSCVSFDKGKNKFFYDCGPESTSAEYTCVRQAFPDGCVISGEIGKIVQCLLDNPFKNPKWSGSEKVCYCNTEKCNTQDILTAGGGLTPAPTPGDACSCEAHKDGNSPSLVLNKENNLINNHINFVIKSFDRLIVFLIDLIGNLGNMLLKP